MSKRTAIQFSMLVSKFFQEFLTNERNYSHNTVSSYRDAFVQFIDFMRTCRKINIGNLSLDDLNKSNVEGYIQWLIENRNCSAATTNYRLAAIYTFVRFIRQFNIERMGQWQEVLSIQPMKSSGRVLNYLTVEGIKLLLSMPDTTTPCGRRHLAILSLMYDTGARVQEIADLQVNSIRIHSSPYTAQIFGKGRKSRIVPLMKEQVEILRTYITDYKIDTINGVTHPLFYNSRHEKLTRAGINYILQTYAKMARETNPHLIPPIISCHTLRHSKAMHLLQSGVNIIYIRDILGHSSVQTTDIYARADSKAKREALEKAYIDVAPQRTEIPLWERNEDLREWLKSLNK